MAAVIPENRTFGPTRLLWLLDGRVSGPRCKAITREAGRLCDETRPCAGAMVDASGIPDDVLAAPVGLGGHASARD